MRKILASFGWPVVVIGLLVIASITVLLPSHDDEASARPTPTVPPLLVIEQDGLRYEIHLPTGAEGLFDTVADPDRAHNLLATRGDDARRLRHELALRHAVGDVDELRSHYADTTEQLRRLGYL